MMLTDLSFMQNTSYCDKSVEESYQTGSTGCDEGLIFSV